MKGLSRMKAVSSIALCARSLPILSGCKRRTSQGNAGRPDPVPLLHHWRRSGAAAEHQDTECRAGQEHVMNTQFALVTGASSGIGDELAAICAREGFDLLVAADRPAIHEAAERLRQFRASVQSVGVVADVTPAGILAEQHRRQAEPGGAEPR